MRLIDADALLESERATGFAIDGRGSRKSLLTLCRNYLHVHVTNAPTIDAVPVVRCAECKHGCKSVQESVVFCQRDGRKCYEMVFKPGDFCSYGERRSDD